MDTKHPLIGHIWFWIIGLFAMLMMLAMGWIGILAFLGLSAVAFNVLRHPPAWRGITLRRLTGIAWLTLVVAGWIYFSTDKEFKAQVASKEAERARVQAAIQAQQNLDEQTSYSRASEIEDVSYAGVKRVSRRIVVPLGRTRDQLTATLERAARELAKETRANAVMVFAYRPQDNLQSTYSAGRAVYAPNGRWEEASSSAPKRVSVDLNDLYFAPPKVPIAVGETVRLKGPQGGLIGLSKEYGSWVVHLARVPVGTEARFLSTGLSRWEIMSSFAIASVCLAMKREMD